MHKRNTTSTGFTIVELLIVVVVIAILAAISIVAYTGISNRAHDSTVQNDLTNFAKLAQMYQADKGVYPPIDQLGSLNLKVAKSSYDTVGYNLYYCTDGGVNSKYGFAAKSKSGKNFYVTSAGQGESSSGSMFAGHACNPIGVAQANGNLDFGYDVPSSSWKVWAN